MIDRTASMGAFATAQDRAECPLPGQANPPNKDRHGSKAVTRSRLNDAGAPKAVIRGLKCLLRTGHTRIAGALLSPLPYIIARKTREPDPPRQEKPRPRRG